MLFITICVIAIILYVILKAPKKGSFTDERDGQTYRTVKIGGKLWMAQNLNYKIDNSWCYNSDDDNGDKYGRLYTWDAAKAACPAGWHLPEDTEWDDLENAVGCNAGKKLKAKKGWKYNVENYTSGDGNDKYGFSGLPGGMRFHPSGRFDFADNYGYWWTATSYDDYRAYNRDLGYDGDNMENGHSEKNDGFSVRCVKDNCV